MHTHSYYSDGARSPTELVESAKRKGIEFLALSDHNSVNGVDEAIKAGERLGVKVIPAIEIRADKDEVLGYFVDYKNSGFQEEILKIQKNVANRVKKIIKKINEKGIKVSYSDVINRFKPNTTNIMEIHLVNYMTEKGFGTRSELWPRYIGKDAGTYVPIKEISVVNAIKLIKKYGGVPVLAHPWVMLESKELLSETSFRKLVSAGLEGIEIDNGDRDERRDEKTVKLIRELAQDYNLIVTSGSDFHGHKFDNDTGVHQIGEYNCDNSVVKELKERLKQ